VAAVELGVVELSGEELTGVELAVVVLSGSEVDGAVVAAGETELDVGMGELVLSTLAGAGEVVVVVTTLTVALLPQLAAPSTASTTTSRPRATIAAG